ncbi:MAG: YebC/PmpR family DNA-binding transcriptional regulator [Clostridia bacterium]|nr:YebC/PmpR family DNA-binding transcriptional regulator [Clostridia bacterium]
MSGHSRWSNIKHTKEKSDEQKAKIFSKIGREIMVAVKLGGSDPNANTRLKIAMQKARQVNMPSDKISNIIKKNDAQDKIYYDLNYEGYGIGGVAVIVKCLSDNKNRTSSDVRYVFDKYGGSLGSTGCVSYMFDNKGVIVVEKDKNFNLDNAIEHAIQFDVLDFEDGEEFTVFTNPNDVDDISDKFKNEKYNVLSADTQLIPQNYVKLDESKRSTFDIMIERFEDNDDVQEVFHNLDEEE